jgi:hypothetical protein
MSHEGCNQMWDTSVNRNRMDGDQIKIIIGLKNKNRGMRWIQIPHKNPQGNVRKGEGSHDRGTGNPGRREQEGYLNKGIVRMGLGHTWWGNGGCICEWYSRGLWF